MKQIILQNIKTFLWFMLPILLYVLLHMFWFSVWYVSIYIVIAIWTLLIYIRMQWWGGIQKNIRIIYSRWVYISVFLLLFVFLLTNWMSHQYLFIYLLFVRWVTLWRYEVRWYVLLWYLVALFILNLFGHNAETYALIPYVYRYVTIFIFARIWDSIIWNLWDTNINKL